MLYQSELDDLTPVARERFEASVRASVVVVRHPMFGDGYDVWWREDFMRFRELNPGLTAEFEVEAASLATAGEYLELAGRELWPSESEPLYTVWPLDESVEVVIAAEEDL